MSRSRRRQHVDQSYDGVSKCHRNSFMPMWTKRSTGCVRLSASSSCGGPASIALASQSEMGRSFWPTPIRSIGGPFRTRTGARSHAVTVKVENVDAHHRRARLLGAPIVSSPADYPYGERQYTAEDLAGHRWTFTQAIADLAPDDAPPELRAGERALLAERSRRVAGSDESS
jgi:hypothetical protein